MPFLPAVSSSFSKRIRASCWVEPSWNGSPASSRACAFELLDPLLEACRDLAHSVRVDPDPRLLHVGEHDGQRQLDLVVEALRAPLAEPGAQLRSQPSRGFGVADERGGLLLRRGLGDELDAVLAGEVVELVSRPTRVDEVGREQSVVGGRSPEPKHLCVVRGELRGVEKARELAEADLGDDHLLAGGDADSTVAPGDAQQAVAPVQDELLDRRLAPGDALGLGDRCGRGERFVERVHPAQETPELEPPEDLLQGGAVGRGRHQLGRVDVERQVAPHRREELRVARLVGVLAHGLATGRRQVVGVRDHLFERAVLRDQLARGLVPDPGDPRDVVRGVPLEPDEVRHLVGAHAVPQLDALGRVDVDVGDPARGHHQRDVLAAELERVPVGRDDAGADPGLVRPRREGRDHVVGLPPLELEVPVAERLDDRAEVGELLAQQVRHRAPALLVGLRDLRAMRRSRVPRDRDPVRLVVREELEEHVREAQQRVRRPAVRRLELLGQREVRAVREVVAVDEEELGAAHGAVVELELLARHRLGAHARPWPTTAPARRSRAPRTPGAARSTVPSGPVPRVLCPPAPHRERRPRNARAPPVTSPIRILRA